MRWLEYLAVGAAIFFAASWTFGLAVSPRNRIGSTIVTVIVWWVALTAWFFGDFSSLHLLWVFPVALLVPAVVLPSMTGRL